MVAPLRRTLVAAGAAVTRPEAQVVDALAGVATTSPAGRLSTRLADVTAAAFGLAMRIVSVAKLPGGWLAVPVVKPSGLPLSSVWLSSALRTTSGLLPRTVSVAGWALVTGMPPEVPVTAPAAMVLT